MSYDQERATELFDRLSEETFVAATFKTLLKYNIKMTEKEIEDEECRTRMQYQRLYSNF